MKYFNIICLLGLIISCSDRTHPTLTPKEYLSEVFTIVEEHSIMRDSVDFIEIKRKAFSKLKDSDSIAVLTGTRTASSGEVVVTAFHNMRYTIQFTVNDQQN